MNSSYLSDCWADTNKLTHQNNINTLSLIIYSCEEHSTQLQRLFYYQFEENISTVQSSREELDFLDDHIFCVDKKMEQKNRLE